MREEDVRREMLLRGCRNCRYFIRSLKQCSRGMENCILFLRETAESRPRCERCYWWDKKTEHCCRRANGCAYEAYLPPEEEEPGETDISCEDCPYGRGRPCAGYCLRKVMRDWKQVRGAIGKAGEAMT